ncbi:MAG TPA: Wzz/FepE/Etk N-terminal domain-containing protein [Chloroflexota bacterium]|jgi:non-specific protein-tyrosine kinase
MSSAEVWSIVRRWLWLDVLAVLLGVAGAVVITTQLAPVYTASTKLLVTSTDTVLTPSQVLTTYAAVLQSRPVVEAALTDLGLSLAYESVSQDIDAAPLRGAQMIVLTVRARDPETAARLANQLAVTAVRQARAAQAAQSAARRAQLNEAANQLGTEVANRARQLDQLRSQPSGAVSDADQAASQAALADAEQRYAAAVRSVSEQDLAATRNGDPLSTVEPAVTPLTASSPRLALNVALGALLGLALGAAIAMVAELRRDRIALPDTVRRRLGLPVWGHVPRVRRLAAGAFAENSPAVEAFRRLRTAVRMAIDRRPSTVLVVGTHAGAGASTIALGLATAWARAGEQVVLVTAAPNSVAGEPTLEDVPSALQPTPVDGLRVLAADVTVAHRFLRVLSVLHGLADRVVVDAASQSLVPHADAVVLVIDAQATRGRDALHAARTLLSAGARVLGTVLNQIPGTGSPQRGALSPAQPGAVLAPDPRP